MKNNIKFDQTMLNLFQNMDEIKQEFKLDRINSIILLRGLLEEQDSIFYECLCALSYNSINPYKKIIEECNQKLKELTKKRESKEEIFEIHVVSNEGAPKKYMFSQDFKEVFENAYLDICANSIVEKEEKEEQEEQKEQDEFIEMTSEDVFIGFMLDIPKAALKILKNNGVYIEGIKEYYKLLEEIFEDTASVELSDEDNENSLPMGISDFATVLSAKYKGGEDCEILGRDKECAKIMRILQKRGKKNAILIGEHGVGKTAIAEKIAYDIAKGNCPESLKDHIVIQVDVNNSIAGTMYRGMAEERFKLLVEYLNTHDNVILFIDEIHMVIGAGGTSGNDAGNMSNALKPFLASKKAKVIGATTEEEYEKHFSKDQAFKRRFERVFVKEPKSKEVYPMLKKSIEAHEKFHGVKITEEMVDYAILISSCFNNTTNNPDRTNDLIDCAMVIAKGKGKESVDRECILENFNINFEKFSKLRNSQKLRIAYHEAGHYLISRKSDNLKDCKGIAISIMPAEEYLGVTVYDDLRDEETIYDNLEYYIDYMAKSLGGRVAEKIYTNSISAGARSDLESANKLAYRIVTQFGLLEQFGNRVYIEDEKFHMLSEVAINNINKEVKNLVEKATVRAEEIISQNEELLKKIVNALLEKSILDENDLEEICKE